MLVDAQAGHRCGGKISELRARIGEFLVFWQSHQCSDSGPYGMEQSGQLGSSGNPPLRLTEFALSYLFRTPSVGFDRRSAPRLHVPNPLLCLRPTTAAAGRGGVRHQLTCTVPLGPNWSPGWSGKACVAQPILGRKTCSERQARATIPCDSLDPHCHLGCPVPSDDSIKCRGAQVVVAIAVFHSLGP
jgi:hypothetical protein